MKITRGIKISKVWHSYNLKQSKSTKYTSRQERCFTQHWENMKRSQFLSDMRANANSPNNRKCLSQATTSSSTWKICRTWWCRTQELWVPLHVLQSAEQGEDRGLQHPRDLLGRCYRAITVPCYRENFFTQHMSDYIKSGAFFSF